jgi:hypothetical protein
MIANFVSAVAEVAVEKGGRSSLAMNESPGRLAQLADERLVHWLPDKHQAL